MHYCDVGDRVVVVDDHVKGKPAIEDRSAVTTLVGTIAIVTRATGRRVSAPITRGSIVDNCGGPGGGHAGCSESGGTFFESRILGKAVLSFRPGHEDAIVTGETEVACHEPPNFASLDCVTPSWSVSVAGSPDYGYEISVFPFDGDTPLVADRAIVVTRARYAGKHATYFLAARAIQVDGAREACF